MAPFAIEGLDASEMFSAGAIGRVAVFSSTDRLQPQS
jgi:hypothetical protein